MEADGSIMSRGVFPSAKNRGNDHAIFCWPVMIIFTTMADADRFSEYDKAID
jgi:hypothetical protein